MKKFFILNRKKILIWTLLLVAIFWAGKGLFKYQFYSTHDLDHHLARSYDAIQTIAEGQFPLRFAGTLNYGCGVQIFNFFYPLLYYLVIVIYPLSGDMFMVFKIISFLSLLVGTIFFYLWAKKETGNIWASFTGAILYLYAPYRFLLIYVRGSPEYLAYAIWPVVLYFFSRAFKEKNHKKFIWFCFAAALSGGLLTISHNFTVMFLIPILLGYLILKLLTVPGLEKKNIRTLLFSFLSGFGLGAFFIFPALIEQKFTKLGIQAFHYYEHFPELWQVIRSKWGYFYSFPGIKDDGMSFQLGYAHWVCLGIISLWLAINLVKIIFKKEKASVFLRKNLWTLAFYILSLVFLFLTLPYSRFVWDKIPLLQTIQFPWRLLGIDVLTISTAFTFWLASIKKKPILIFLVIFIPAFAFFGNRNHLLSEPVMADIAIYYSDPSTNPLRHAIGSLGTDVLPKDMPGSCYFTDSFVRSSAKDVNDKSISYTIIDKKSTTGSVEFDFNEKGNTNRNIVFNLSYFPGVFKFHVNGVLRDYQNCDGYVCFDKNIFNQGKNLVTWNVVQTPIEKVFNVVTVLFVLTWLLILIGPKRVKPYIPILIIFGVFLFFRTYNLPDRIGFGWDQERDARAIAGILSGNLTLIGPRVMGPGGFFLPPYFFYILAPFYVISGGNPSAVVLFVIFVSVLFFVVSYFAVSRIFSKKTALLFLSLWAVNPLAISMDTIAWNPVLIPTVFMFFLYLVYISSKKKKIIYPFLLGSVFGLGISFHMQFVFAGLMLIPLVISFLKKKEIKNIVVMAGGFLAMFFPIFLFDLRHNFINANLILEFLRHSDSINRVFPVFDRFISFGFGIGHGRLWNLVVILLILIFIFALGLKSKNDNLRKVYSGLIIVWVSFIPLFLIFAKNPSEYYFNFIFPIMILVIAQLLSSPGKLVKIFTVLLMAFFVYGSTPLLNSSAYGLNSKIDSVKFLKNLTENSTPFNVSFNVPANEDAGFRYLLDFYKVKYTGDPKDTLIEFVIPQNKVSTPFVFGGIGLNVPQSWTPANRMK
jgi:hypothetical protein